MTPDTNRSHVLSILTGDIIHEELNIFSTVRDGMCYVKEQISNSPN